MPVCDCIASQSRDMETRQNRRLIKGVHCTRSAMHDDPIKDPKAAQAEHVVMSDQWVGYESGMCFRFVVVATKSGGPELLDKCPRLCDARRTS
jgi:hypothetical protein